MSSVDSVIDVRAALGSLSPADLEALLLVEWEGVDHAAGGMITSCSANTFKVRVHRGQDPGGDLRLRTPVGASGPMTGTARFRRYGEQGDGRRDQGEGAEQVERRPQAEQCDQGGSTESADDQGL